MRYTIVYISDDLSPACFGTFQDRASAARRRDEMDANLDAERDPAGGSAGSLSVCRIEPLRVWQGW